MFYTYFNLNSFQVFFHVVLKCFLHINNNLNQKDMPKERIELSTFASLYCIYKYDALTD